MPQTNSTKTISNHLIRYFRNHYSGGQVVRNIGINATKLSHDGTRQLSFFDELETLERDREVDMLVDEVRRKYGFSKNDLSQQQTRWGSRTG